VADRLEGEKMASFYGQVLIENNPETLRTLYWEKNLSINDIAKLLNLHPETIWKKFNKLGIPRRKASEGRKLKGYGTEHLNHPNLEPSEDLCYILGVCLGDGYITKFGTLYSITLSVVSKEFAFSFKRALEKIGLHAYTWIVPPKGNQRKQFLVRANSKLFYNWYKTLTLSKIEQLLMSDRKYLVSFLRGFYESEGSYSQRRRRRSKIRIVNTKKELADLIFRLIQKLGFRASIRQCKDKRLNRKETYCIELLGKEEDNWKFIKTINPLIKVPKYMNGDEIK
jgi:intein-encoded DNA endonuclease-like protein